MRRKHNTNNSHCAGAKQPPVKLWRPWEDSTPSTSTQSLDQNLQQSDDESESGDPDGYFEQVLRLIKHFEKFICTKKVKSARLQDRYNYRTNNPTRHDLAKYAKEILDDQPTAFKLNVSFGFILRHIQSRELIFFYASKNNRLFDKPSVIRNAQDADAFASTIDQEDLLEYCRLQRPNSSYVVVTITNILFYVDKLKAFPIGCPVNLPTYVRNCRALIGLDRDRRGLLYTDKLCIFRCLALSRGIGLNNVTRSANAYLTQWLNFINASRETPFNGVLMTELDSFERCFAVRVEVFSLEEVATDENDGPVAQIVTARIVRRSVKSKDLPTLSLNLFDAHFSYIKDLQSYCKNWKCGKCDKLFRLRCRCIAHERNCIKKTRIVFKGGGFGAKNTVFDDLDSNGIFVRPDDCFYDPRITFDFEAFVKPILDAQNCPKGAVKRLTPASVAVCSNVEGHEEPRCFVINRDEDTNVLMGEFFSYIQTVSAAAFTKVQAKLQYVIDQLDVKIAQLDQLRSVGTTATSSQMDETYRLTVFEQLKTRLLVWMRQIVVLGFNSQKFDINLIRAHLFPYLLSKEIPIRSIIKKGSAYHCITLDECMFLDIRNYLSPTVSYEKWIKSLGIEEGKLWFPYESMKTVTDLDIAQLPPKEAFWSTLKRCGISEENYATLQRLWHENGFRSLRDLLIKYNIQDVKPFIKATDLYFSHWKALDIDPFKSGSISLPGLALSHLMKTLPKHVILPLISGRHDDVYYCIRRNIVGGLSTVFHRYHEVGVTTLPNGMKVKLIVSKDANGLYLYCLALETGTGLMVLWRSKALGTDVPITRPDMSQTEIEHWQKACDANLSLMFGKESMYPYAHSEVEWLEWYAHSNQCRVGHRFNGNQKTVLISKDVKYPVDGYIKDTKTVLQFHGCYWHGHECALNRKPNPTWRADTAQVTSTLRRLGYQVIEMWECEWKAQKTANMSISTFVDVHVALPSTKNHLTGHEILESIKSGIIFGLLECDIEVPRFDPFLDEYFREFPPIFKNVEIGIDDIGDYMKNFALQRGYMKKPKRCLIGSYFGKKILLPTPLVRWYLEKDLQVTRIYQVIQMRPKRCFQHLADEVSMHRRAADADTSLQPVGSTWKDTGNHYYGKTATDTFKFKNVKVADEVTTSRLINDKRFCSLEEVGESSYEVTMDKNRITVDLPITVAFFVYGAAKQRMLEFYFDFLKKFLVPGSFQLTNMDTDSFVMALGSENIDDLVLPHLREMYEREKPKFLVTDTYSQRTPGLFKDELVAQGIIVLCAKTYFAWGPDFKKTVSKGLSKATNDLCREDFAGVLRTGEPSGGVNCGFRPSGDKFFQYEQIKLALSALFIKRKVCDDGISTLPLDN